MNVKASESIFNLFVFKADVNSGLTQFFDHSFDITLSAQANVSIWAEYDTSGQTQEWSLDGYAYIHSIVSAGSGVPYTLPAATAEVLGGIKVGNGVSIDADGKLHVTYSYTLPAATDEVLGGIKIGNGLKIDSSGIANPTVNNINVSTGADATFALTQDANTVITCTNTPTLTLTTGTTGMYSAQIVGAAKINTIEGVTWSGEAITAVTTIGEISILNGLAVGTAV